MSSRMNANALYKKIIQAASDHGEDDPDQEVCDLQDVLYDALQQLELSGGLPDLIDTLTATIGQDQPGFEWLQDVEP